MKGHRLFFSPVYAHVMHPAPLYIFTFTFVVNLMKLSWKCWMSHKLEKKNEIFGYDIFKFKLHCWVKKKDNLTNLSVYLHKCEIKKNNNNFLLHSPFPSVLIYVESKLLPTYWMNHWLMSWSISWLTDLSTGTVASGWLHSLLTDKLTDWLTGTVGPTRLTHRRRLPWCLTSCDK